VSNGTAHKWEPIEDLPTDWEGMASPQLPALHEVWLEQKGKLEASGALARFNDRVRREWAIETGVIEQLYSIDRRITEILIERGVDSSLIPHGSTDKDPELVVAIIRDHESAIDWLFEIVRGNRPVSTSFVKELHALMTQHQSTATGRDQFGGLVEVPLQRGTWKLLPDNPTRPDDTIHEYCPPEQVASEMDRLIEMHSHHVDDRVPVEIESAWLHHRFTQIHPFQDGNGRVARAITSLVFLQPGWFPLVVNRDDRESYIDALERADNGDLRSLISMFERLQKVAFAQALSIGRDSLREGERLDHVIASLGDIFSARIEQSPKEWSRARTLADGLVERAYGQFTQVRDQLIAATGQRIWADVQRNGGEQSHCHRAETEDIARRLDYFADHRSYRGWVRLKLVADSEAFVLLSLTGVGREFRGVVGASLCFFLREADEEGQRRLVDLAPASDELFQLSYNENETSVSERFDSWLERGLTCALAMWRQSLPEGPAPASSPNA